MTSPSETLSPTSPPMIPKEGNENETQFQDSNLRLTIHPITQPSISISDRSTSTTGTSNHSPPVYEKPILLRSKSNLKQSLNSKREKKAAKTLAIVTGIE